MLVKNASAAVFFNIFVFSYYRVGSTFLSPKTPNLTSSDIQ